MKYKNWIIVDYWWVQVCEPGAELYGIERSGSQLTWKLEDLDVGSLPAVWGQASDH